MDILEIEILTQDLNATEKFYGETLELQLIFKDAKTLAFSAGQTTITFKLVKHGNPVYHFAFNIPSNQLEEALEWASAKLEIIPVEGQHVANFDTWNAKAFYFYDNNGNILEFIARFDLKNRSLHEFKGASVRSVSEIAIVTDSVDNTAEEIKNSTGLSDFSKQPPHDNFRAIGDDRGLFIISEAGRYWYPTMKESNKFPVKVKILVDEKIKDLEFNQE